MTDEQIADAQKANLQPINQAARAALLEAQRLGLEEVPDPPLNALWILVLARWGLDQYEKQCTPTWVASAQELDQELGELETFLPSQALQKLADAGSGNEWLEGGLKGLEKKPLDAAREILETIPNLWDW